MAVEKLQEYVDSVDELQKAYSKVREYGAIVGDVARCLNNFPFKMTVSNVQVSFVVTGEGEYHLDGNNWPSAKQLAEVLSDYISKRERAKNLYASLSSAQKQSVKPPPDI